MTGVEGFVAIGVAFFLVAVAPGPANLANAVVAMRSGRSASFVFSLGLTCGIGVWGAVAVTGMGALLQSSVYVLTVLKVLGGLYLLWLAWQSVRSATAHGGADSFKHAAEGRWFLRGVVLNLSNPKTVVAWMAALAVGLDPNSTVWSLAIGYAVCMVVTLAVNLSYMMGFSLAGMMGLYRRIRRGVDAVMAGLYAFAGLALLRSALHR
ncbi:MAG: LysE family translocator [Pseudomonadota bacterium]